MGALAVENVVVVTTERNRSDVTVFAGVAGRHSPGNQRTDRALGFPIGRVPVKTVARSRSAEDPSCVLVVWDRVIVFFCLDELLADADGRKLVAPDAAVEYLVSPCLGIEIT